MPGQLHKNILKTLDLDDTLDKFKSLNMYF
jgi:hypothetical protein